MTSSINPPVRRLVRQVRLPAVLGRLGVAIAVVWMGFVIAVDRWRAVEAAIVVSVLRLIRIDDVQRAGDQILVLSDRRHTFSADIGPLCSSLGIVLAFGAFAALVATGARQRRLRAFVLGASIIVVCNLVRIGATLLVGIESGPGSIERFHDGIATWFAVVFVLGGLAVFVTQLPAAEHADGDADRPVLSRRSSDTERSSTR